MNINSYIVQAVVSIITASLVAFITLIINERKFYNQQWWERKANKYDEILSVLGRVKKIYDDLDFSTADGSDMNHKRYPDFFDLKYKLQNEAATASLYLDTKSAQLLTDLDTRFFDEWLEYGTCIDNDMIRPTVELLDKTIKEIIKNAKRELKRK